MRIVSLLPSATELLFALGAGDDVVGVTFECDYPPEARARQVVSTSALPAPYYREAVVSIRRQIRARASSAHGQVFQRKPEIVITLLIWPGVQTRNREGDRWD